MGFSLLEAVITLAITSCLVILSHSFFTHYFYYHKAHLALSNINNILNTAKNATLITNQSISVCPYNLNNNYYSCINDWHKPIIMFYNPNNKIILNKIILDNIIFKYNKIIDSSENIIINQINQQAIITFNPLAQSSPNSGSIYYSNMYYNQTIRINKIGRIK